MTTLGARVIAASLIYKSSKIAPQPSSDSLDNDEYWNQLKSINDGLLTLTDILPTNLQLPQAFACQHAIFVNILIHTATMCLHKTAAQKARCIQGFEAERVVNESYGRMFVAAMNVLDVFQQTQDLVMALKNPIQDYTAYIATLVFLEDFKARSSIQSKNNALFLIGIFRTAGETHAVARMLSAQLGTQLEIYNIDISSNDEIDVSGLESRRTAK
ncbi:hypothetical protein FOBRF1_007435 [Fusarium oxysporum]